MWIVLSSLIRVSLIVSRPKDKINSQMQDIDNCVSASGVAIIGLMRSAGKSRVKTILGVLFVILGIFGCGLFGPWALGLMGTGRLALGLALFVVVNAISCVMLFAGIFLLAKR